MTQYLPHFCIAALVLSAIGVFLVWLERGDLIAQRDDARTLARWNRDQLDDALDRLGEHEVKRAIGNANLKQNRRAA